MYQHLACGTIPSHRLFLAVLLVAAALLPAPATLAQGDKKAGKLRKAEQPVVVPPGVLYVPDLIYGKPDAGIELRLDLARPIRGSGPFPAVVCIPGGGWLWSDRKASVPLLLKLAQEGFVAVSVSYRSTNVAPFPAQVHDVKCAVRWLRANAGTYRVDPERIGALGYSAGGHLACMLGTTTGKEFEGNGRHGEHSSRVQAVVSYYGLLDLERLHEGWRHKEFPVLEGALVGTALQRFLGEDNLRPERLRQASPIQHVCRNTAPTLLLHGTEDTVAPVEQSQRYAAQLKKGGVEARLVQLAGAPHNFTGEHEAQAQREVLSFLRQHLQSARQEARAR